MTLFPRLLVVALTGAAIFAQNPLAPASDPFSGTFRNEEMKLELTRKGADYTGVILLSGQSLPVRAKVSAGKLAGTFESQGQAYSFQAALVGSRLSLTTDGVTHVLEKAAAAATPPAVVGEWRSPSGIVRVNADGSATLSDKPHRWSVDGNMITFTGGGESIKVPFEMAGDAWTWKFPAGQLALTRVTAESAVTAKGIVGTWQGPAGNVQLNLDGSAVVGGVTYRYTQTENQLTLAGPDGTFVANVQQTGDAMTWIVNGKTLQFQRAAATWAIGGPAILPELVGKWCERNSLDDVPGACFTLLADGSFQYANGLDASANSDAGTWAATADSLTATSKMTGVKTFRLEKRNHPKTGDPMLVLDGTEFTTAYKKTPWPQ